MPDLQACEGKPDPAGHRVPPVHAGQADIVRELIDGAIGWTVGNPNLPPGDQVWWQAHYDRVEQVAGEAAKGTSS